MNTSAIKIDYAENITTPRTSITQKLVSLLCWTKLVRIAPDDQFHMLAIPLELVNLLGITWDISGWSRMTTRWVFLNHRDERLFDRAVRKRGLSYITPLVDQRPGYTSVFGDWVQTDSLDGLAPYNPYWAQNPIEEGQWLVDGDGTTLQVCYIDEEEVVVTMHTASGEKRLDLVEHDLLMTLDPLATQQLRSHMKLTRAESAGTRIRKPAKLVSV